MTEEFKSNENFWLSKNSNAYKIFQDPKNNGINIEDFEFKENLYLEFNKKEMYLSIYNDEKTIFLTKNILKLSKIYFFIEFEYSLKSFLISFK